jgi:hypothetical protein
MVPFSIHRRLAVAICLWAVPGWTAPAGVGPAPSESSTERLGEEAELARGMGLYDTGQYSACVDAFERLLASEGHGRLHSPAKIESARTYHGACLIGVGRTTDAERVFRDAILENPQMKAPDGLLFPEAVVELFLRVRESMLDEIRRAEQQRLQAAEAHAVQEQKLRERERQRVEELGAVAEKETVVEHHHRWIATIPFGVGQFQNDSVGLGWFFLLTESAATGLLAGSLFFEEWYRSQSDDPRRDPDWLNGGIRNARRLQCVGGYGLLGLGLVGIVEAHLSFVPEVSSVRKRKLPENLRLPSPKATSTEQGASLRFAPWGGAGLLGGSLIGSF